MCIYFCRMVRVTTVLLLFCLTLFASCVRGEVSRSDWQAMKPEEKLLVIESFRGHESARDAKGGSGRLHPKSSEYYRERIDDIYRGGDERTVAVIWEELVEEKPAISTTE